MLKRLTLFLLLPVLAFAQGVRVGDGLPTLTTTTINGNTALIPLANAPVQFCNLPANAVPCTNKATTYTDSTLGTPCATSTQVVRAGTSSCVANTDAQGNWGVWVAPGQYAWTFTDAAGNAYGPYTASVPVLPTGATFTGAVVVPSLNGIPFADQSAGSDACVKITAAIASLPASGGIVDARGFTGTQFCLGSNTIAVGSATKGVHLLLGNVTLSVQNTINIFQGSSIIGIGSNGTMSTILRAGNAFPVSSPMIQMQTATVADSMLLRDFMIDMNAVAGSNGIDMGKAQDQTEVSGVYVLNSVGGCLTATNASVQQVKISRFDCTMATTTGAVTAVDLGSGGGLNDNFYLSDIGITSQSVTQLANDIRCNACNMHMSSAHLENAVNGILFQTATSGASFVDNLSGLSNVTNVVNIDATFTGSVSLFALRKLSATNTVANALAALGCGDEFLGAYVFSTGTSPPQLFTTCSNGGTQLSTARQINSTVATGTAPLVVASTTNVANLNASSLNGATFSAPGAIGGGTPGSAAHTTISASGQITSTLGTGTAPLAITSTTPVANLTAVPTTYNAGGTQQTGVHIVIGQCTLGTNCAVSFTGSAQFTNATSYACSVADETGIFAAKVAKTNGTAITITGNGTDVIDYVCIGN